MTTPPPYLLGFALLAATFTGCADRQLLRPPDDAPPHVAAADYPLGCGDVIEVSFAGRPAWDCAASVGLNGRLPLGGAGTPAVQGLSLPDAHHAVAVAAGVDPIDVTLTLAEFRAARLYLTGPENGVRRTLPYVGPEPVLDFLNRAGALKRGSAHTHNVRVLRPNVAAGGDPEVFPVDARDPATNVVLQASDEVVVAETFRSRLARLVPDWILPVYRKLTGLLPPDAWPAPRG